MKVADAEKKAKKAVKAEAKKKALLNSGKTAKAQMNE